jgi:hypothetical protein
MAIYTIFFTDPAPQAIPVKTNRFQTKPHPHKIPQIHPHNIPLPFPFYRLTFPKKGVPSMSQPDPATQPRQRLLYLHARTPSVFSEILGYTPIEPLKDFRPEIIATDLDWPYKTVHDAIIDGWQIVQFPYLQAPFDDRDLDVVGYEFILQKMEVVSQ